MLRQVPKDELDRVVSRIAAYDKQEFASFLDVSIAIVIYFDLGIMFLTDITMQYNQSIV